MSTVKFTKIFTEKSLIEYNSKISKAIIKTGEDVEGTAVGSALFACFSLLPFPEVKVVATVLSCGLSIATSLKDALFDQAILCSQKLERAEDLLDGTFNLAELELECEIEHYDREQYFIPVNVSLLRIGNSNGD